MSIGENVEAIRKNKNMTQTELAELVNVKQSMVAQIERGTRALTVPLAIQIAKVLDCKLDDFIKDKSV